MLERRVSPHVPIETRCPAGRIVHGQTNEQQCPIALICQSGREHCLVYAQLHTIVYRREYTEDEAVARGTVGGYCILADEGFVNYNAIFTVPPPPDQKTDEDPF